MDTESILLAMFAVFLIGYALGAVVTMYECEDESREK
jgi:hypothetical protein